MYGTIGDPTFATAPVPTNGDDVDAAIVVTTMQRLLDFIAQCGHDTNALYAQLDARLVAGVPILRNVASIAALKALSTGATPDGGVAVVKDPVYAGGNVSRVALFVYDATSVADECAIPGTADAYLVVTPNSGTGRWINVVAGVGWKLGVVPEFLPKPRDRAVRWSIGTNSNALNSFAASSGWNVLPPNVAPDLAAGDTFHFDFDCSARFESSSTTVLLCVMVSVGGGAFSEVFGTRRYFEAPDLQAQPIHISGLYVAGATANHQFKLAFDPVATSSNACRLYDNWTARGIQYVT